MNAPSDHDHVDTQGQNISKEGHIHGKDLSSVAHDILSNPSAGKHITVAVFLTGCLGQKRKKEKSHVDSGQNTKRGKMKASTTSRYQEMSEPAQVDVQMDNYDAAGLSETCTEASNLEELETESGKGTNREQTYINDRIKEIHLDKNTGKGNDESFRKICRM